MTKSQNINGLSQPKVFAALKKRGSHASNIWYFDSPKTGKRLLLTGDVAFIHTVLLEGDTDVETYLSEPPPVRTILYNEVVETQFDAYIYLKSGRVIWCEYKRSQDSGSSRRGRAVDQLNAQSQAAREAGVDYEIRTENDFRDKELLFDNWLNLCGCINRCRNFSTHHEEHILTTLLDKNASFCLNEFYQVHGVNKAFANAVVARALQKGVLQSELVKMKFGVLSEIRISSHA